jgi:hypothetical protein
MLGKWFIGGNMNIENGWCFSAADFSLQAAGKSKTGRVVLVRDTLNKAKWHKQTDELKESDDCPELFITGEGVTLDEAIVSANLSAAHAKPIYT